MTQPGILHDWYSVPIPGWVVPMVGTAVLLIFASFVIDLWRASRRRGFLCAIHLQQGLSVTMVGSAHGAPYCPLCLFPEVKCR